MSIFPDEGCFPIRFDQLPGGSYQTRMRKAFISQARTILSQYDPQDVIKAPRQIGFEIEYSVVNNNNGRLELTDQAVRDAAIQRFCQEDGSVGFVGEELGAAQIEICTRPIDIRLTPNPGNALLDEMEYCEQALAGFLKQRGAFLLRIGAYPLIPIRDIQHTMGRDKYEKCPRFHSDNQRPAMNSFIGTRTSIDVHSAVIPALTNSVQVNFDCDNLEQGIELLNRSLMHAPFVTALGANAGMIDQSDSGFADIRYIAWAISHDIRTWDEALSGADIHIGIPSRYYGDINDYFNSVLRHPFFMEVPEDKAFAVGIGTYWRDARIKFLSKPDHIQLVLELRPLSTQPTIEGDYSLLMFYIGRIYYDYLYKSQLLPIEYVRANKELSMRLGRQTRFVAYDEHGQLGSFSFDDLFDREIDLAMQGLSEYGMEQDNVEKIRAYINYNYRTEAPVDHFRTLVQNEIEKKVDMVEAMTTAIQQMKLIVISP